MTLKVGQKLDVKFKFNQKQVDQYISITGDDNPIHYDDIYSSKTIFKKPVIHGFLSASIFSKIFGTIFPGKGSIYYSQNLKFVKPMYVDENYVAKLEVFEEIKEKNRYGISTTVVDSDGNKTIIGEAQIFYK